MPLLNPLPVMLNVTSTDTSQFHMDSNSVMLRTSEVGKIGHALWLISLVLLIYDILLTLDVEVKYFWNARPGLVSYLFFLNRYWPAANLIFHNIVLSVLHVNPSLCSLWFQYIGYSASVEHLAVGAILLVRIYALFNGNKRLLMILIFLYASSMTAETIIVGLTTHHIQDNPQIIKTGCVPKDIPTWCWVYWLPSVGFDSLLLFLALWKTLRKPRDTILRARAPLLVILLRDSFLYFAGIMLVTLANLLAWYIQPIPYYGTFIGCHISFQSILGCRSLLNIRETAAKTRESERQEMKSNQSSSGILTTEFDVSLMTIKSI